MNLDALSKALAGEPSVQLAVLFGSVARGRSGPMSDLDLALVLEPDSPEKRRQVEVAAERAARRETDFIYLAEAPPLLRFQIARDGMVLVERHARAWTRFKARAMVDWWDWAPIARQINAAYIRRLKEQVAHG